MATAQNPDTLQLAKRILPGAQVEIYKSVGAADLRASIVFPPGYRQGKDYPAMVFFFGGGWARGAVTQFKEACHYFAGRGMITIAFDYRVSGRHNTTPVEAVQDARSAMRWVRINAPRLGIRPDQIVAAGGSAGGHLALSAALLDHINEPGEDTGVSPKPAALVLFNPVTKTTEGGYGYERLGDKAKALSPVDHVHPGVPPAILFHGESDTTVPIGNAEEFCARMLSAGNICELHRFAGQKHGFYNTDKKLNRQIIDIVDQFLTRMGYLQPSDTGWPEYHGDGARSHYSALNQIDTGNVDRLKVAWVYESGGADTARNRTQMQCNPIIIDGILYGVSADIQAFAIDASNGKELWKTRLEDNEGTLSRGVSYWADGTDKRIFFGAGQWLHALDARTGQSVKTFGAEGRIDLKEGIRRPGSDDFVRSNTPNTIYKNLIITGARVGEFETALLGDVRAYDVRTGGLVWTFHTIPEDGEPGYETWQPEKPRLRHGAANPWMGMAIDRERGIVYIPTGSASHDFFGGNRKGDNLYANCLLALEASTGRKLWHYQLVHHDIWDRDPPAPPNLLTVQRNGKQIDVVALVTKQGYTFVFDRVTGEPVFPVKETAFPQDAMPGEHVSATQPVPQKPAPFARQSFTEKDFSPFVADRDSLTAILRNARTGSPYIPITDKMTIFFPGTDGGAQWGGAATDPEGILYVPSKEIPVYTTLIPKRKRPGSGGSAGGKGLYEMYCAACHGADREGNHDGSYPGLVNVGNRLSREELNQLLLKGRGMMPSFSHISDKERKAIMDFLFDTPTDTKVTVSSNPSEVPYQHTGYNRWYHKGYPVSAPPWGTLTAIDLNTGEHRWQVPLGEYKELTERGIPLTGTDNYGGPVVTAGGLIFIAATRDEKIRAFDRKTGRVLWEHALPAAGYATPSTYRVDGRQYIVIACGGGKLNTKSGSKYLAFCLDDD